MLRHVSALTLGHPQGALFRFYFLFHSKVVIEPSPVRISRYGFTPNLILQVNFLPLYLIHASHRDMSVLIG